MNQLTFCEAEVRTHRMSRSRLRPAADLRSHAQRGQTPSTRSHMSKHQEARTGQQHVVDLAGINEHSRSAQRCCNGRARAWRLSTRKQAASEEAAQNGRRRGGWRRWRHSYRVCRTSCLQCKYPMCRWRCCPGKARSRTAPRAPAWPSSSPTSRCNGNR